MIKIGIKFHSKKKKIIATNFLSEQITSILLNLDHNQFDLKINQKYSHFIGFINLISFL